MGALTPQFLADLETKMAVTAEDEYARLAGSQWWPSVAKKRDSVTAQEIVTWLLATAMIEKTPGGGNIGFEDLVFKQTTLEHDFAGKGFKIRKSKLEDVYNGRVGGAGIDLGVEWSKQIMAQASYWPQQCVADALKIGHTSAFKSYDDKNFFATDHPLNPFDSGAGTYSNLFVHADYRIDEGVTVDVALKALAKVRALIASMKMPNGTQPRRLRPKQLIVPPSMYPRAVQLTNAKIIAQAAASGGAGADVEALVKTLGYATPIEADELVGFESETTYFVIAEEVGSSELGGLLYIERDPFKINYYGELSDAQLGRMDELEWHCKGRNSVAPGHPYYIFKVAAA